MREIEIKLRVNDLKAIENRLKEKGCSLSEPISQHDTIYSHGDPALLFGSSKEGDCIIRIRRLKERVEFNLKQQRSREMDNTEYETVVDDPGSLHQILL